MILTSLFNLKGLGIAAAVGALVAGSAAGYITYKVEHGRLVRYQLESAEAKAKAIAHAVAIQIKQDGINQTAAVEQAKRDQREADLRSLEPERIIVHVKDSSTCITYGFVRVLNAAASGDDAAFGLAAGQPDDACTTVTWRSLAGDLADDYISARANTQQLDSLIATVRELHSAASLPVK